MAGPASAVPKAAATSAGSVAPVRTSGVVAGPLARGAARLARLENVLSLLTLVALIALPQLPYSEPLEMDAATYAVVAREMRAGERLYTDVWDHKPPAIHATFLIAQSILGDGTVHTYVLGVLTAVATMFGIYAAIAGALSPLYAAWAALFWVLVNADLGLQANQPNTEAFINPLVVWAFALLARAPSGGRHVFRRVAAAGVLLALASLYKQVAAVYAVGFAAALVFASWSERSERRRAVAAAVLIGAIGVATWLAVAAYFWAAGRFADFWEAVFVFNRQYSGSLLENLRMSVAADRLLPPVLHPVLPLLTIAAVGAFAQGGMAPRRTSALLLAYAVVSPAAVLLPGRFLHHYYQLELPVLVLGATWGLAALRPAHFESETSWLRGAGGLLAGFLLLAQLPSYGRPPDEWSREKFGARLLDSRAVAGVINRVLLPGETFFLWGHEAELYYYRAVDGPRPPSSAPSTFSPRRERKCARPVSSPISNARSPSCSSSRNSTPFPSIIRLPAGCSIAIAKSPSGHGRPRCLPTSASSFAAAVDSKPRRQRRTISRDPAPCVGPVASRRSRLRAFCRPLDSCSSRSSTSPFRT